MTADFKLPANVRFNENSEVVSKLLNVIKNNGGYCPCRIQRTPENLCICAEFIEQITDPDFTGYCHCKLYYKEK